MNSDEKRIQDLTMALDELLEVFEEDAEGYYVETRDNTIVQVSEEVGTRIEHAQATLYNEVPEELFPDGDDEDCS